MNAEGDAAQLAKAAPRERRIVATRDLGELWLALHEGGSVVELMVLGPDAAPLLGAIVKGQVTRLAPAVHAIFVDLGFPREVFVPLPPGPDAGRSLAPGDETLVQITREAQGGKGWRARLDVTIPGWTLVLAPHATHRGVSRKIPDADERARLRVLLDEIAPAGFGLIARTTAAGLAHEQLAAERDQLLARWSAIEERARSTRAPAALDVERDPTLAFLRDQLAEGVDEIIVDPHAVASLSERIAAAPPPAAPRVRAHPGPWPAVEGWGLERAWETALADEVRLPGGGRLTIGRLEALTAIDVDSGQEGGEDLEETALAADIEAAPEVARQVRLRALGGLIVVDFIDVRRKENRARIAAALVQAFAGDRLRTRIAPLSEFSVAEITRQRRRRPLAEDFTAPCPCCRRGFVFKPEAEARSLLRELRRRCRGTPAPRARLSGAAPTLAAARDIFDRWGAQSGLPGASSMTWAEGAPGVTLR